jgi:hypothetical protein
MLIKVTRKLYAIFCMSTGRAMTSDLSSGAESASKVVTLC